MFNLTNKKNLWAEINLTVVLLRANHKVEITMENDLKEIGISLS